MWPDRQLAFLDGDDPSSRLSKIRAFELTFILILFVEYWARAIPKWGALAPNYVASLALASVLCAAALWLPLRRLSLAALALVHVSVIWHEFPAAGNHAYLEALVCTLCASLDVRREQEQVLFLRSVRWMICVIFFYSGLQKLVHGYWFDGQYLLFSLWVESFRPIVATLIPADELARLVAYTRQPGDGPYLVDSLRLTIASNLVYAGEIAVVPLLLVRRTRVVGVGGAMLLIAAIEAGARELFFGLLMASALLLFCTTDVNRRVLPAFAVMLAYLLLVRLGVAPAMVFY